MVQDMPWSQVPSEFQSEEMYTSQDLRNRFKAWCEAHSVHYYGRPREDFFPNEARTEAAERGKLYVLLDDLS